MKLKDKKLSTHTKKRKKEEKKNKSNYLRKAKKLDFQEKGDQLVSCSKDFKYYRD